MFSLLVVPDEKFKAKMISSAKERVSSLEDELGVAPSFEKIRNAMINGLSSVLDIELIHEKISDEEHENANRIALELFKDEEWLFKR